MFDLDFGGTVVTGHRDIATEFERFVRGTCLKDSRLPFILATQEMDNR